MSENTGEIEGFERLLTGFQALMPLKESPKTFLEISRFPHYELVCSNILAFFLDPNEQHGLGNVFLKSLLEASGQGVPGSERSWENIEVIRECPTPSKKRIDIAVVEAAFILGIENKIHASANNPFAEYDDFLEGWAARTEPPKQVYKILLSLWPENPGEECKFAPLTYEALFGVLEKHLGARLLIADQRYVTLLIDFVNTIKNLKCGTHMDPKLLNFISKNEKSAHAFYIRTLDLMKELEGKGKEAKKSLGDQLPGVTSLRSEDAFKNRERNDFAYCIWCEATLESESSLGLELQIRPSGWRIIIWPTGDEHIRRIEQFVRDCEIILTEVTGEDNVWQYGDEFPYAEDAESAAKKFRKFVEIVAGKLRTKKQTKK